MIEWRDVPKYEGLYQVSNTGLVLSLPKRTCGGKILKPAKNKDGYLTVTLCRAGEKETVRVNRLVAIAFIPNPDYKLEVNHIDGDKLNNAVENLEWATRSENELHSFNAGLKSRNPSEKTRIASALAHRRPVRRIDDGAVFPSIKEAAESVGADDCGANISKVCRGLRDTASGFRWEYVQRELDAKGAGRC